MDGIVTRRASLADLQTLVELRCRFVEEVSGSSAAQEVRENVRRLFQRHLPTGQFICWLAEANGQAVGTGALVFWECLPNASHPTGRCAYIMNMYTAPGYRRRGVAERILHHLLDEARAAGLGDVTLHALPAGARIYQGAGFQSHTDEMVLKL